MLVQGVHEVPWEEFEGASVVGLSAGASAPEILVNEIIEAFKSRFDVRLELSETVKELENFPVSRELRDVSLAPEDMAFVNGA